MQEISVENRGFPDSWTAIKPFVGFGSLMNWRLREGANEQFVGSRGVSLVRKVSELDLIVADNHYWTMIGNSI